MSEFVPLASYLRAALQPAHEPEGEPPAGEVEAERCKASPAVPVEFEAIAEARRFRAALADALDVAVAELLEDVAAAVLARELRLAPADVRAIVAAALERYRGSMPIRVRAHPLEAPLLDGCGMAVAGDAEIRRGDVMLDVRSGTIDVSLGARLAAVLAGGSP